MTFSIATLYAANYKPLAEITVDQNRLAYCRKWNYVCSAWRDCPGDHLGYRKIEFILDLMNRHSFDWILWADCDVLITNFSIQLESLVDSAFDLIIANDCNEWNVGVFLLQNSPGGRAYMEHVWKLRDKYQDQNWQEQQAMIDLREEYASKTKVVPQRTINAYDYAAFTTAPWRTTDPLGNDGQWQPGDFLLHWAGLTFDQRMKEAPRRLAEVMN